MTDVLIYHRQSDRLLGIQQDSVPLWGESEIKAIPRDDFYGNEKACIWTYSNRKKPAMAVIPHRDFITGIAVGIKNKMTASVILSGHGVVFTCRSTIAPSQPNASFNKIH